MWIKGGGILRWVRIKYKIIGHLKKKLQLGWYQPKIVDFGVIKIGEKLEKKN